MNAALRQWSVKRKLGLLIATFTIGFVVFGAVAFSTLNTLKVNGPYYMRIVAGKDAIADVLPPPKYIIESYLIVLQLLDASPGDRQKLINDGDRLRGEYNDRQKYWAEDQVLKDTTIQKAMIEDSFRPAIKFFDMRDREFVPAINRGDMVTARKLALGPMKALYSEHRTGVDTGNAQKVLDGEIDAFIEGYLKTKPEDRDKRLKNKGNDDV